MSGGARENEYRPEERVNKLKLLKIQRTAEWFMSERGDERDFQIDVVGVYLDKQKRRAVCRLYEQVL
jgi:Holliday junction resolvase-like predicted endonuclease